MELEGQDFHAKVADAYLRIAEEHPERFVVIEADKPPAEVFDAVRAALEKALASERTAAAPERSARRRPSTATRLPPTDARPTRHRPTDVVGGPR